MEAGKPTASDPGKQFRAAEGIPIVPAMDGFRAFAILGIVLLHLLAAYWLVLPAAVRWFAEGALPNFVDILFILSGFVVFLPTVARGGRFGRVGPYALRRIARLLPAYWMAMAVVALMLLLWPGPEVPAFPPGLDWVIHAVALHQPADFLDADFSQGLLINGPLWTLSLEMTFYLTLPLIAGAYFRHPFLGLLIALSITVSWKLAVQNVADIASLFGFSLTRERELGLSVSGPGQFPAWAYHFALGMTAASLFVTLRSRLRPETLARWAIAVQVMSLLALIPLLWKFSTFGNVLPAVVRNEILLTLAIPTAIAAFMLATALAPWRAQAPFAVPVVRRLGDISYGIYLIHFPVILILPATVAALGLGGATNPWILSSLALTLAVAYGYLSGRFLEQPIRRWAHRFGRRAQIGNRAALDSSSQPASAR
jgi:peptidoglycan/LPS O-acetylase OafA/YrhL